MQWKGFLLISVWKGDSPVLYWVSEETELALAKWSQINRVSEFWLQPVFADVKFVTAESPAY